MRGFQQMGHGIQGSTAGESGNSVPGTQAAGSGERGIRVCRSSGQGPQQMGQEARIREPGSWGQGSLADGSGDSGRGLRAFGSLEHMSWVREAGVRGARQTGL